jgi:hypothetical protein
MTGEQDIIAHVHVIWTLATMPQKCSWLGSCFRIGSSVVSNSGVKWLIFTKMLFHSYLLFFLVITIASIESYTASFPLIVLLTNMVEQSDFFFLPTFVYYRNGG